VVYSTPFFITPMIFILVQSVATAPLLQQLSYTHTHNMVLIISSPSTSNLFIPFPLLPYILAHSHFFTL
jgi:uncharacterized membrane protein